MPKIICAFFLGELQYLYSRKTIAWPYKLEIKYAPYVKSITQINCVFILRIRYLENANLDNTQSTLVDLLRSFYFHWFKSHRKYKWKLTAVACYSKIIEEERCVVYLRHHLNNKNLRRNKNRGNRLASPVSAQKVVLKNSTIYF